MIEIDWRVPMSSALAPAGRRERVRRDGFHDLVIGGIDLLELVFGLAAQAQIISEAIRVPDVNQISVCLPDLLRSAAPVQIE